MTEMSNQKNYAVTIESFDINDLSDELASLESSLESGLLNEEEKSEISRKKKIIIVEMEKRKSSSEV